MPIITPGNARPAGFEIGYTQITTNANVTDTSEATATALISPGALTFDGAAVVVSFFCAAIQPPTSVNGQVTVTLFEGATQITRLAKVTNPVATIVDADPVYAEFRFTPTVGAHTYKLCAFCDVATGTPTLTAGVGGTAAFPPAFTRFVKV